MFDRPTLTEIRERIRAEVESRLGLGPFPPRSNLGVLSDALAGASHLLHGHLDYVSEQIIPDSADAEHLERWADIWGVSRLTATAATGSATFTGTGTPTIPQGTEIRREDGVLYETTAAGALSGGTATIAIAAKLAGLAGNAVTGTQLTLTAPIAGVNAIATASGAIAGGTDAESDDLLRARLLLRIRNVPQGGSGPDYVRWALETPGASVTRAYAIANHLGLGTVGVPFATDGTNGTPIPDGAEVALVQAYLDTLRPLTAAVTAFAPATLTYTVTLATLSPNDVTTQDAVEANVEDFVKANGGPGQTLLLSQLREAIATSPGVLDFTLSAPLADTPVPNGSLAILAFSVV